MQGFLSGMKRLLAAAAILAAALLAAGCAQDPKDDQLEYHVSGSACSASITYTNSGGNAAQVAGAVLPWSLTFEARRGFFAYVSAQNQCASGNVRAEIFYEGELVEFSESTGAYVIATASGSL